MKIKLLLKSIIITILPIILASGIGFATMRLIELLSPTKGAFFIVAAIFVTLLVCCLVYTDLKNKNNN